MPSRLVLTIPQPCQQSWAAMTPTAAGRHCAACQTTVVDFTLKTDAEILAYLAGAATGRTCGRFAAGQLDRPLQRAELAAPTRWRAWLAAAVAVWGLREGISLRGNAQAPTEQRQTTSGAPTVKALPDHLHATSKPEYEGNAQAFIVRGVALDSVTHEGLPGVTILIENTTVGVPTKMNGTFELAVPAQYVTGGTVELQINYLGYVTQHRHVSALPDARPLQLELQTDVKGMLSGEIVVAGGVWRRPWPWHPRRFYSWSKYWLTRPFQR